MKINCISYTPTYQKRVSYGNQVDKIMTWSSRNKDLLIDFLACENLGKFKMTFDEAKRLCELLGHSVTTNAGSHAQIHISDNRGILPLVIPHNSEKILGLLDKKRLRCLFTNQISEAFRIH